MHFLFLVSIAQSCLWRMVAGEEDLRVREALWQELINVQCSKPPKVVATTSKVLNELGLKEEATQLRGWLVCQSVSGK